MCKKSVTEKQEINAVQFFKFICISVFTLLKASLKQTLCDDIGASRSQSTMCRYANAQKVITVDIIRK